MAPLAIRQNHSLGPSLPRPHNGPHTKPVDVKTHIDPVVFAELFAGTVGIFILSVLVWKTGHLIRSFTQHRVVGPGKSPTTRYAKTWYGWVTIQTHERNKQFLRDIFSKLGDWTAWKSTRTDYQWAWWDPGQEALETRRRDRKRLQWLPKFLINYESPIADDIWNPGPSSECRGALSEIAEVTEVTEVTEAAEAEEPQIAETRKEVSEENTQPIGEIRIGINSKEDHPVILKTQEVNRRRHSRFSAGTSEEVVWSDARMHIWSSTLSFENEQISTLRDIPCVKRDAFLGRHSSIDEETIHLAQFDGPSSPRQTKARQPAAYQGHQALRDHTRQTTIFRFRRGHARKYQDWSAQMQTKAKRPSLYDLRDSSGPPGTPFTENLTNFTSEHSATGDTLKRQAAAISKNSKTLTRRLPLTVEKSSMISRGSSAHRSDLQVAKAHYSTVPLRLKRKPQGIYHSRDSRDLRHSLYELKPTTASRHSIHDILRDQERGRSRYQGHRLSHNRILEGTSLSFKEVSDGELRLLHELDRKLLWLFNEMTPGQKPYHFALLANHWLNRETWLVIDPISRVSNDARRRQGDPRFNVPYPEPELKRKSKYPENLRKKAFTPRIDSWRAAVNRQRRISGAREILKLVDLYEDSAEEPPEGHIDPACWILPKPPQGFEMSTRQKHAWYEGGAGWQERLDDWQRVSRGYRLHKAVFEGRVNRNRAIELGQRFGGYCRQTLFSLNPGISGSNVASPAISP
ncbi:hypothetical protein N7478_010340 [Penicillium angulare]|uniref:uncharacterized protein n=1 Tax=Penicillium angulare TaxID=116970 RepID=UPI00253FAD06|nr:uncharacterized protein N7478_010340 [Penicillium angulare]KAJ5267532.1 hypothetical protein N7478_010340 [Penicillium angulare]